jgi:hypothetical protein
MRNKLLTLAAMLALLAVLGEFFARPVIAQVRAALVQDVDNPARHVFQKPLCIRSSGCNPPSGFTAAANQTVVVEFVSL